MPACLESRRNPISCLCPLSPGHCLLDHAYVTELLPRRIWQWTGNRGRPWGRLIAKVAFGCIATLLLAGMKPETQTIGKINSFACRDSAW